MGGHIKTAAIALALAAMLSTAALTEEASTASDSTASPVVSMQQPISLVGHHCDCKSCQLGVRCKKPARLLEVPSVLNCPPVSASCDAPGCSEPGCMGGPSCGAAAPSCGAPTLLCDDGYAAGPGIPCGPSCGAADPSCGAAGPGCGAADPTCGLAADCDSCGESAASCGCKSKAKSGLFSSHLSHKGKCGGKCGGKCIECCSLDLCSKSGCWVRADTLLWWTNDDDLPTLVTTSPAGTPLSDAGVLGFPDTTSLYDGQLFGDMRVGGRLRYGFWADECNLGFDGAMWGLLKEDETEVWQSEGDPIIARPFTNTDPLINAEDAQVIAYPGAWRGGLTVSSWSDIVGVDAGIRKRLKCCSNPCDCSSYRLDAYAGFRYFRVQEGVRITEDIESTSLVGPLALGTTFDIFDQFETTNQFYGGVIGVIHQKQHQRWTSEFISRVAIGNMNRQVAIAGQTTTTVPSLPPVTQSGGILAQPTNIGIYEEDEFVVLPEIQLNLLYNVTRHTKFVAGYTAMFLGDIVRPGDIMSTRVNGLLLDDTLPNDGPDDPTFAWNDSSMWLMGLSLGVEIDF